MFRFLQDVSIFPCVAWEHSQFETMWKKTYRHLELTPKNTGLWLKCSGEISPHLRECQQLSSYSLQLSLCSLLFVPHSWIDGIHFWGPSQSRKFSFRTYTWQQRLRNEAGFSNQITCLALPSLSFLLTILYFVCQSSPEKQTSKKEAEPRYIHINSIAHPERERFFKKLLCCCRG